MVSKKLDGSSFAFSKTLIAEKTSKGATFLVFAAFFKTETLSSTIAVSEEEEEEDDDDDEDSNASVSVLS